MKSKQPIIYEGDEYFPFLRDKNGLAIINKGLPIINGQPEIGYSKYVPYPSEYRLKIHEEGRSIPVIQYKKTPKFCSYHKVIKHDWKNLGGLTIAVSGKPGSGKTNLLTGTTGYLLGAGVICYEFNDRNFEAKHISKFGYFDKEKKFHPFIIRFWIPKNYQIVKSDPKEKFLWEERKNVFLCEYSSVEEIVSSMQPYVLTVIYTEPFDLKEQLRVWVDISLLIFRISSRKRFMFIHHELAKLFPENPDNSIYNEINLAAYVFMDYRKNNIGILTAFHILNEVFYKIGMKYHYYFFKKPHNRSKMYYAELKAKNYNIQQVNISSGNYYRKYKIGKFPEIDRDAYKVHPIRELEFWAYPQLVSKQDLEKQAKQKQLNPFLEELLDPVNILVYIFALKGNSFRKIQKCKEIPIRYSAIKDRVDKLEDLFIDYYDMFNIVPLEALRLAQQEFKQLQEKDSEDQEKESKMFA